MDNLNNEDVTEVTNEEPHFVGAMSDEEIKEAAEKIGSSPYAAYSRPKNEQQSSTSQYSSYDYSTSQSAYSYTSPPQNKKQKRSGKAFKFVGMAAAFGLIAFLTFFAAVKIMDVSMGEESPFYRAAKVSELRTTSSDGNVNKLVLAATSVTTGAESDPNVVVQVVKDNMSSAVAINCTYQVVQWIYQYQTSGGGSGFIVGENKDHTKLLIATNSHVVESATKISVTFCDGQEVEATVLSANSSDDLAIVAVPLDKIPSETSDKITIAKLGSSDEAEVGEMVIAIGNALGYGQSVTVGYLSAKNREVTIDGRKSLLLQTDAAINSGNSGGPLFNVKGEVVGINCAKYTDTDVEGMCFAIPISTAKPILEELMAYEVIDESEKGWLGVTIENVDEDNVYGMPRGILVTKIEDGSAADKAGIYPHDIITAVNGARVYTVDDLKSKIASHRAGTTVKITVMRLEKGVFEEHVLEVVLQQKTQTTQ